VGWTVLLLSAERRIRNLSGKMIRPSLEDKGLKLDFSQIFDFVRSPPVAGRSGSGLLGRKLSQLTPTNVGTLCAFLTGA